MSRDMENRPYFGLLGLDRISPGLKVLNFLVTVLVGVVLAFLAWFENLYSYTTVYHFQPFTWTLLFLFLWPTCAVILWLRLTGLKWRWAILAVVLMIAIYICLSIFLHIVAGIMAA